MVNVVATKTISKESEVVYAAQTPIKKEDRLSKKITEASSPTENREGDLSFDLEVRIPEVFGPYSSLAVRLGVNLHSVDLTNPDKAYNEVATRYTRILAKECNNILDLVGSNKKINYTKEKKNGS